MQLVERKHFHVTFSSGRRLVRGRQVTKNRQLGRWLWLLPVGTVGSFTLLPRENLGKKTCLRACLFAQSIRHGPWSRGPDFVSGSLWLCPVEGPFTECLLLPGRASR